MKFQFKKSAMFVFFATAYFFAATTQSTAQNKYTTSLREAAENLAKAENNKDVTAVLSAIDSNFSITARGETEKTGLEGFKEMMSEMFSDSASVLKTVYNIEEVKAGSAEPVWAGYDKGTFTQTIGSKDGQYHRKVSGPYFRAWKLTNGQWKCYQETFMAFTCDGNDCK
jgi:ketosteroid isomerase-like protein